jgi:hypothetical protein
MYPPKTGNILSSLEGLTFGTYLVRVENSIARARFEINVDHDRPVKRRQTATDPMVLRFHFSSSVVFEIIPLCRGDELMR